QSNKYRWLPLHGSNRRGLIQHITILRCYDGLQMSKLQGGVYAANGQTPKSVTPSSVQRSWFKANNGINGRGPPEAGRMPFMPAVSLNQWSGALPKRGLAFELRFFSDSPPPFSVFACSAVQSFGPLNVCCPNASSLVGARFKLLSAGAGSKHGDLCNESIRDG